MFNQENCHKLYYGSFLTLKPFSNTFLSKNNRISGNKKLKYRKRININDKEENYGTLFR